MRSFDTNKRVAVRYEEYSLQTSENYTTINYMGKKKKIAAIKHKQTVPTTQPKKKRKLIEKKTHLEFIGALLTIPFLISVLILNFNSISNMKNAKLTPTPAPNGRVGNGLMPKFPNFFAAPIGTSTTKVTPDPASQTGCDKTLGPVSITSPDEGDTVTANPVEVDISYDDSTHCAAAWSYRINGGDWSGYDDRSIALYNLPTGAIKFELRVKSIASSDTTSLTRNFTYNGQNSTVIPPTASTSAH